jgi:hypothetical protein
MRRGNPFPVSPAGRRTIARSHYYDHGKRSRSPIASYSGTDWSIEKCALLNNSHSRPILGTSSPRSQKSWQRGLWEQTGLPPSFPSSRVGPRDASGVAAVFRWIGRCEVQLHGTPGCNGRSSAKSSSGPKRLAACNAGEFHRRRSLRERPPKGPPKHARD